MAQVDSDRISKIDRQILWHPYSQHGLNSDLLPIISAKGAYLRLSNGQEVLDAISSWWVNIHGHGHPSLVRAIAEQAERLDHVIFAGFTHEPAVQLAELLVSYPPIRNARLERVFYSDNGSTAVEVALKMAYQYHLNLKVQGRNRFLALKNSYHGDTLGAMAVGEPSGFHSQFRRLMPDVDFVEPGDLQQLHSLLEKNGGAYAAFIFEPLVQGASGMKMYEVEFLNQAMRACKDCGILTIADEIFTGFYRTGKCFSIEYLTSTPDFLCLSKGITGGILPLAATLAREEIFAAFVSREMKHAFLHGHSYTANPIACGAAIASWKLLQTEDCQNRIGIICQKSRENIQRLQSHPKVLTARVLGTIGAVELKSSMTYFSSQPGVLLRRAVEKGILLRPLGNVLYAVPPYCCTAEEIDRIYSTLEELIDYEEN